MIYQEKIFTKEECIKIIDLAKTYKSNAFFTKESGIVEYKNSNSIIYDNNDIEVFRNKIDELF